MDACALASNRFQSTLPARGATHELVCAGYKLRISIHAPRTGSDARRCANYRVVCRISIHAPRTGSDLYIDWLVEFCMVFQSTLPARGATLCPMRT